MTLFHLQQGLRCVWYYYWLLGGQDTELKGGHSGGGLVPGFVPQFFLCAVPLELAEEAWARLPPSGAMKIRWARKSVVYEHSQRSGECVRHPRLQNILVFRQEDIETFLAFSLGTSFRNHRCREPSISREHTAGHQPQASVFHAF